jgi:SAM-dependent methyltransferase
VGDPRQADNAERQAACLAAIAATLSDMRAKTIAELGLAPGMAVLDAGCGAGELAVSLARQVGPSGRVVGVDLTPVLFDRARAAAASAGVEVEFREGDIREMPFDRDEFDAVRSERVFQYLDPSEAPRAAAELLRVTKSGGIVQIVDPDHLQTAITATDRELAHLLTQQFTLISKNPESGLYLGGLLRAALGGLLRAAGAEDVLVELWPSTFKRLDDFRAVRDLKSELAYLVARHLADAERAAAFMADLEARDRAGTFLSTVITYSATGRKPDNVIANKPRGSGLSLNGIIARLHDRVVAADVTKDSRWSRRCRPPERLAARSRARLGPAWPPARLAGAYVGPCRALPGLACRCLRVSPSRRIHGHDRWPTSLQRRRPVARLRRARCQSC